MQTTSHSKSCPKNLPALLFSSWKSLPHLSTLYIDNLLVGKYLVCAIPQNITDEDAEPVYLLLNAASCQTTGMQPKPHCSTSLLFVTHCTAHTYIQSGRTKLQTTFTENIHWINRSRVLWGFFGFVFKRHLHKHLLWLVKILSLHPFLRFPTHAVLRHPILQETNIRQ